MLLSFVHAVKKLLTKLNLLFPKNLYHHRAHNSLHFQEIFFICDKIEYLQKIRKNSGKIHCLKINVLLRLQVGNLFKACVKIN
jgi:hypothetical protein